MTYSLKKETLRCPMFKPRPYFVREGKTPSLRESNLMLEGNICRAKQYPTREAAKKEALMLNKKYKLSLSRRFSVVENSPS